MLHDYTDYGDKNLQDIYKYISILALSLCPAFLKHIKCYTIHKSFIQFINIHSSQKTRDNVD